jgi:fluoroacetyl-CoA thioesterase
MKEAIPEGIEPGLEGFCERIVSPEMALSYFNPAWPNVFSTPAMIGMMEMASSNAVRHALPHGSITVGVRVEVDHLKSLPLGAIVTVMSKLLKIEGRRLIFEAEARSGADLIGRGRIFHAIVNHSRFVAKAEAKPASR